MSEEELSILRERLEGLEVILKNSAGEWDDLCDRLNGLSSSIEGSSIDDGEKRLARLEGQLEDGTIWLIERDIEELQKKVEELGCRLLKEAEMLRKESNDSSSEHADLISEVSYKLDEAKKLIDEQEDEIAKLTAKIDKVMVAQVRLEEVLMADFEVKLRGFVSYGDVAREFEANDMRYDERIVSIQRQLNAANAEIAHLQHAVRQPALVNQVLGCIIGLTLIAGSAWILVKLFYWIADLIR